MSLMWFICATVEANFSLVHVNNMLTFACTFRLQLWLNFGLVHVIHMLTFACI